LQPLCGQQASSSSPSTSCAKKPRKSENTLGGKIYILKKKELADARNRVAFLENENFILKHCSSFNDDRDPLNSYLGYLSSDKNSSVDYFKKNFWGGVANHSSTSSNTKMEDEQLKLLEAKLSLIKTEIQHFEVNAIKRKSELMKLKKNFFLKNCNDYDVKCEEPFNFQQNLFYQKNREEKFFSVLLKVLSQSTRAEKDAENLARSLVLSGGDPIKEHPTKGSIESAFCAEPAYSSERGTLRQRFIGLLEVDEKSHHHHRINEESNFFSGRFFFDRSSVRGQQHRTSISGDIDGQQQEQHCDQQDVEKAEKNAFLNLKKLQCLSRENAKLRERVRRKLLLCCERNKISTNKNIRSAADQKIKTAEQQEFATRISSYACKISGSTRAPPPKSSSSVGRRSPPRSNSPPRSSNWVPRVKRDTKLKIGVCGGASSRSSINNENCDDINNTRRSANIYRRSDNTINRSENKGAVLASENELVGESFKDIELITLAAVRAVAHQRSNGGVLQKTLSGGDDTDRLSTTAPQGFRDSSAAPSLAVVSSNERQPFKSNPKISHNHNSSSSSSSSHRVSRALPSGPLGSTNDTTGPRSNNFNNAQKLNVHHDFLHSLFLYLTKNAFWCDSLLKNLKNKFPKMLLRLNKNPTTSSCALLLNEKKRSQQEGLEEASSRSLNKGGPANPSTTRLQPLEDSEQGARNCEATREPKFFLEKIVVPSEPFHYDNNPRLQREFSNNGSLVEAQILLGKRMATANGCQNFDVFSQKIENGVENLKKLANQLAEKRRKCYQKCLFLKKNLLKEAWELKIYKVSY